MPNRGCPEAEAREYMGCSQNMFDELKSRRIVLPLRKGWYSYALLDRAMDFLEKEAIKASAIFAEDSERPSLPAPRKRAPAGEKLTTREILDRIKADERKSA